MSVATIVGDSYLLIMGGQYDYNDLEIIDVLALNLSKVFIGNDFNF